MRIQFISVQGLFANLFFIALRNRKLNDPHDDDDDDAAESSLTINKSSSFDGILLFQ
jgi:hypothetical protein